MPEKKVPETGPGSPAGPRWFYSKTPELVVEVKPERYADANGNVPPFLRVAFNKQIKPDVLVSEEGRLGSKNKIGADSNANLWYGVYYVVDPGPVPVSEADKDAREKSGKAREFTEEEKRDRMIIDHFRKMHQYKITPQDNRLCVTDKIEELTWDPHTITEYDGFVIPGGRNRLSNPASGLPFEKRVLKQDAPIPEEIIDGRRKDLARTAVMGRK